MKRINRWNNFMINENLNILFGQAIRAGDLSRVIELLEQKPDISYRGFMPIKWAISYGHVEILHLLLSLSQREHQRNQWDWNLDVETLEKWNEASECSNEIKAKVSKLLQKFTTMGVHRP
jgi:hypothetical protein